MPKIEEVEIEKILVTYLSKEKVIGCFNVLSNKKLWLLLDDI